jgi:hypothetical protein
MILETGAVKAQGNWEAIKHSVTPSISKFRFQQQRDHDATLAPNPALVKLDSQVRAKEEAQADLARQTGDLGLYCQDSTGTTARATVADLCNT